MATQKIETGLLADDSITADKLANSINTDIATGVAALPKAGGTMTGALVGTTAAFNSGTANVVASFTSTDTIAAIQLVDANGNVEIGAVGNDFHVMNAGGAAKMIVQSDGNVGIGNSSPQQRLTVGAGSGSELISIFAGTGSASGIHFTDTNTSGDDFQGFVTYDHSVDALRFGTAEEERVRIDVSGAVGIGQVPETARWSGHDILQVGGRATFLGNDTVSATGQTALLDNLYYDASGNFQHRGDSRGVAMQFVEGKIIFSNSNQTTGTPTVTPRMTLDGSGDVLIGQTSQTGYAFAQKLVVGDGDDNDGITIQSGATHQGNLAFNHSDGTTAHGRISYQHQTNYMQFFVNNSEKMRIDSSGSLVLQDGTTYTTNAPTHRGSLILAGASGATSYGGIEFHPNAGGGAGYGSKIGASDAEMTFSTRSNSATFTQRMVIKGDGTMGFGTSILSSTFTFQGVTTGDVVTVRTGSTANSNVGAIVFRDGGSDYCGQITCNGATNSVAYISSSDYRLKENVDYTWNATTRLKQLKPARFNWISDDTDTLVDGFLAHEVSSIVPEAVVGDKDEVDSEGNPVIQGIDHSKLVPLLTKAIQEQQTLIESLTARISTLEG